MAKRGNDGSVAAPPLLRSPPFPWVAAATAAVSRRGPPRVAPLDVRAIGARIAAGRVGGSFWARPAGQAGRLLLRPGAEPIERRIARALALAAPEEIVAILPEGTDTAALQAAGIGVAVEPVDPWSLLTPGRRLIADLDDEWTLLAAMARIETIGHDTAAVEAALAAALGDIAYRDPFGDRPASIEETIALLRTWRGTIDANRTIAAATGISWWKRDAIGQFLWAGTAAMPPIVATAAEAMDAACSGGGSVAVWPSRAPEGLLERSVAEGVPIAAIEDGFIRSVGLGSDLHRPWSIVVDGRGIYYDPRRPSDLEHLLATHAFPPALLARAEALRAEVVARGISKYASVGQAAALPRRPDRRTILVAGQVEDDMSVKAAGGAVAGNLDLLVRARRAEPGAYILFKPHPDVDAGHRIGGVPDADLLRHCDEVVRDEAMPALLARVDGVHVLTSLTGFEALLRGLDVTVHGHPFYAGWGLTRDLAGPLPRRTRRLTLAELVAGTLILYPRYLDPRTLLPCPPEVLLERFAHRKRPHTPWLVRLRRVQGMIAKRLGTTTT